MTEKSESYEVEQPDPFEKGERAKMVLGEMGLTGKDNEVLMVSCKVEQLTFESKIQPVQYEQARGYQLIAPQFTLHIPIYNPGQMIDDATGNLGILTHIHRMIARALDQDVVFRTASERLDLRTTIKDAAEVKATSRFDTVRKEVPDKGEVL